MIDIQPGSRHERVVSYLASHKVVEQASYLVLGGLSFLVFILPVFRLSALAFDNGYHFPFFGPEWMFIPNVVLRVVILFGPSLLGISIFYWFIYKAMGKPILQMRAAGKAS